MPDIDRSKVTLGVAISAAAYLIVQTVVVTWWASSISANLQNLKDSVASGTANRYSSIDASRDKQIFEQKENAVDMEIKALSVMATNNHDSVLSLQEREKFDDQKRAEQSLKLAALESRITAVESRKP